MHCDHYQPTLIPGATFIQEYLLKDEAGMPLDFTGCTARSQFRADYDAVEVLDEFTTENGGLSLGGASGTVTLRMEAVDTAAVTWESCVFDVFITLATGDVERWIVDSVAVLPRVTR